MEKPRAWVWVVAVAVVLLSMVLSMLVGAVAGGVAGFFAGRQAAGSGRTEVQEKRLEWTWPQGSLPLPWGGGPQVTPKVPRPRQGVGGALIQRVVADSPAEQAGLQVGDIITAVDDKAVSREQSLSDLILAHQPGDQVRLSIVRGGEELTMQVRLGEHPEETGKAYLGVYWVLSAGSDSPIR